ncbi:hypothetical protein VTJ83DRAFT_6767 [Remersonia thermophila]|uniref:Uncharacterized protein n=1 Tax=Remersonia thermophila TaxID=72144 RepID=A0ABR4D7V9_9PEZI
MVYNTRALLCERERELAVGISHCHHNIHLDFGSLASAPPRIVFHIYHLVLHARHVHAMTALRSRHSALRSLPPGYTPDDMELAQIGSAPSSIFSAPPPYSETVLSSSSTATTFRPSVQLQIETQGKPWLSFPFDPRPDYIPIFSLCPDQPGHVAPEFASIRPERGSGSCYLTPALEANPAVDDEAAPIPVLATTTYRFGPGRPPIVRLFAPYSGSLSRETLADLLYGKGGKSTTTTLPPSSSSLSSSSSRAAESDPTLRDPSVPSDPSNSTSQPWDAFPIRSSGLLTRATTFRTRLGTFEWRYGSRSERRALARTLVPRLATAAPGSAGAKGEEGRGKVSSLLILDRVVRVARAYDPQPSAAGAGGTLRTPVAYLLRGPALRAQGSGACSAGNGGRLVLYLRLWEAAMEEADAEGEGGEGGHGRAKADREMAVVLVVATCLVMLKREVDRRRAQQIAMITGGG